MSAAVETGEFAGKLVDVVVAVGSAGSGKMVVGVGTAATGCSWRVHHMVPRSSRTPWRVVSAMEDSCCHAGDRVLAADENSWEALCRWGPWGSCMRPYYDAKTAVELFLELVFSPRPGGMC